MTERLSVLYEVFLVVVFIIAVILTVSAIKRKEKRSAFGFAFCTLFVFAELYVNTLGGLSMKARFVDNNINDAANRIIERYSVTENDRMYFESPKYDGYFEVYEIENESKLLSSKKNEMEKGDAQIGFDFNEDSTDNTDYCFSKLKSSESNKINQTTGEILLIKKDKFIVITYWYNTDKFKGSFKMPEFIYHKKVDLMDIAQSQISS